VPNDKAVPVSRLKPVDDEIPAQTRDDDSSTEEDWDRMDSASDLDTAATALCVIDGLATVRGGRQYDERKTSSYLEHDAAEQLPLEQSTLHPLITKRSFGASQQSLRCIDHQCLENNPSQSGRPVRLSNVEEQADDGSSVNASSPIRSVSQTHSSTQVRLHKSGVSHSHPTLNKSGSVRSMPAHVTSPTLTALPDPKSPLAMTPENIKPLLENAKEVQARLGDCIAELRALVSNSVGVNVGVASGEPSY
jgi:serine/arginine repetitive matrix protein 2